MTWERCLQLLPADSNQAIWIREHAKLVAPAPNFALLQGDSALDRHEVDGFQPPAEATAAPHPEWVRKFGPAAPVLILLLKGKTLFLAIFKAKFLFSFFSFIWIYWLAWGPRFGIGFALMILVHELGHYIDIQRRGLPAEMPVFLPGLGAYVRWQALGVSLETRAAVSLAGPAAGILASAVSAYLWMRTGNSLYAALAHLNAVITVMNVVPVWVLDGGQAVAAINRNFRFVLLTTCLALWVVAGQPIFLLPAAGFGFQLFRNARERKEPEANSGYISSCFGVLLILLALLLHYVPNISIHP